jgi:hypothetical protein
VTREPQAVVDLVRLVEMRVVDEALPPDGGARLLKVDAHDDAERVGQLVDDRPEQCGVLARGCGVMDGAGADDHQQTRVAAGEDLADLGARLEDGGGGALGDGQFFLQKDGGKDDAGPFDS